MQQVELSDQLQSVLDRSARRNATINLVLAVLLIIVLAWALYAGWRQSLQHDIDAIAIHPGSLQIIGQSALCPGDTLRVAYSLDIKGSGVIAMDDSVTYQDRTVKFSMVKRDIIDKTQTRPYEDSWTIPPQPDMPIGGGRGWLPGRYVRKFSAAASNVYVSRYIDSASFQVAFTIRDDCAAK